VSFTLTTSGGTGFEKGMILDINGRWYKIVRVVSASEVVVRRTFRQWLSDVWDAIFFWVFD
jgi:hypothetical protein